MQITLLEPLRVAISILSAVLSDSLRFCPDGGVFLLASDAKISLSHSILGDMGDDVFSLVSLVLFSWVDVVVDPEVVSDSWLVEVEES